MMSPAALVTCSVFVLSVTVIVTGPALLPVAAEAPGAAAAALPRCASVGFAVVEFVAVCFDAAAEEVAAGVPLPLRAASLAAPFASVGCAGFAPGARKGSTLGTKITSPRAN